jgi:hypothetical protein
MIIDLHTHTNRSDGSTPPRDLVRLARAAGIGVLAVTDHDSTEALPECLDEGRAQGVRVIPGIEMSSRFEGRDVHVLGYGLDAGAPALQAFLAGLHRQRRERVGKICQKLAGLGLSLSPEEVLREAGGKSVGRRHVARAMVRKGLVGSLEEAFQKYLGSDSPANLPANELTPAEAATLIRSHGGLPVLAHPGFLDDDSLVERVLNETPVAGLEVFHRYDSAVKHLAYLEMARRRNLLVTGGSDFHGDDNPKNAPLGGFSCPPEHWKEFEKALRRDKLL